MSRKITQEILESYLKCKYKAYLKLAGEKGEKSEYELQLVNFRENVIRTATDKLVARYQINSVLRNIIATDTVLKQNMPLLLNVTVHVREFFICLNALIKTAGSSGLGEFYYIPVLFHETERPTQEQKSLLQLHSFILGELQGRQKEGNLIKDFSSMGRLVIRKDLS
jgi:predicted RecB family nuclease